MQAFFIIQVSLSESDTILECFEEMFGLYGVSVIEVSNGTGNLECAMNTPW